MVRCLHESSLHDKNCFITLTYDDDHVPEGGTLVKRHFQLFMKRLRKSTGQKIRYYMAGEYGDKLGRPHYHALLFGYDFPDKYQWQERRGNKVFRSPLLEKIWHYGFSEIGSVSAQSAGYVARYVMKKINGDQAKSHYTRIDKETGEIYKLEPEYNSMSLRPGIAKDWWDKYGKTDVHENDEVILRDGKRVRTPKYYDKLLKRENPKALENIKETRQLNAKKWLHEQTPDRLLAKQKNTEARLKKLRRTLV